MVVFEHLFSNSSSFEQVKFSLISDCSTFSIVLEVSRFLSGIEFEEIFVNGKNSSTQYFYHDGELFNYSIYPITLSNINGKKEHIFSIIYIYDNNMLLGSLKKSLQSAIIQKMIL